MSSVRSVQQFLDNGNMWSASGFFSSELVLSSVVVFAIV